MLCRGYILYKHLSEFFLINMNGRMYDPLVARFLSPDPYVANTGGPQGYNRYSYCLNNPLKYSDLTGERANPSGGGELNNMERQMEQLWDFNVRGG